MDSYPEKQEIIAEAAPAPIGPYSVGMRVGHLVFTAGQIGIRRETGELVSEDVQAQTRQALENLKNILEAAGSSLELVVKTTIFVKDLENYALINEAYAEYFATKPPARSTVGVAALPAGAAVEIEAIAVTAQPRGD